MADFANPVAPAWGNVRRISATDPVDASTEDSPSNWTGKDLVARTQHLKGLIEALQQEIIGGTATPAVVAGVRQFTIAHNLGTTAHTVDIVAESDPAGAWGEWWIVRGTNSTTVRTNGTYAGTVRYTVRRTTSEV